MKEQHALQTVKTPLGPVVIQATSKGITLMHFSETKKSNIRVNGSREAEKKIREATAALRSYFQGNSRDLHRLPLDVQDGTEFQRSVWKCLSKIPTGKTLSYGEVAKKIGRPKAVRAVGAACGANPICLVIPCHRVIGKDGSLTGFAAGTSRKRALLALEKN